MQRPPIFTPSDWYWENPDGRVYSSARQVIVGVDDVGYKAWQTGNRVATAWPRDANDVVNDEALQEVLDAYNLYLPTKAGFVAYAADARWNKEVGGVNVMGMMVQTDLQSQSMITGAYSYVQANPSAIIHYKLPDGTFINADAATIEGLANAVGTFVQACFAAEKSAVDQINSGAITSFAQIDAVFAAL